MEKESWGSILLRTFGLIGLVVLPAIAFSVLYVWFGAWAKANHDSLLYLRVAIAACVPLVSAIVVYLAWGESVVRLVDKINGK